MTRHIRGGHVSFWLGSTNNVTKPSQIRRAQKNAGERFLCIHCAKGLTKSIERDIHQKVCEYRDPVKRAQLRIKQRRKARLGAIYDWLYDLYAAIQSFVTYRVRQRPKPFIVGPQPKVYTPNHRLLDSEREKAL